MQQPLLLTKLHKLILADASYNDIHDILSQGANLSVTDYNEDTLLHYAVMMNRADIVELLLRYCANVNAKNNDGDTPLHIAVYEKTCAEIITNLIFSGACPYIINNSDESVIDLAHDCLDMELLGLIYNCLDLGLIN